MSKIDTISDVIYLVHFIVMLCFIVAYIGPYKGLFAFWLYASQSSKE